MQETSSFCAYFFQQCMQLPCSGQAGVVVLLRVAAMPAHWYEAPAAVPVGEGRPVLAQQACPQSVHLHIQQHAHPLGPPILFHQSMH